MKSLRPNRNTPELARAGLALALAAIAAVAAPPLRAADFSAWKHRQSLEVAAPGIVSVALPPDTLDAARLDLGDLRVVDPAGREVSLVLQTAGRAALRPLSPRAFRVTLSDTSTQLLVECGAAPIEELILETPAPEFVKRTRVETSTDGATWTLADEGALVFRQAGADRLGLRVSAPFVRLTLDDTRSRPVPFTGAKLIPAPPIAPTVLPLGVRLARREEFAGETVLTLELAAAHVPLDMLTLATPERLFQRRVTVGVRELRDESAIERTVARDTLYRLALEGEAEGSRLSLPLGFSAPSRELIVHVANDDSPPLAIAGVEVSRFEVVLVFDAAAAGSYTLLSGHPQTAAPRYDVSPLRSGKHLRATRLAPGPLAPNPGYRAPETLAGTPLLGAALDPAPWSFRKPVQLAAAGVHQLELDLDVLAHAQPGFADLRLVRDGAQVPYLLERTTLSRALALPLKPAPDPKRPRVSRWEIELPRAALPLTQLTLVSPTALFQRHLRISENVSDDRGHRHDRTLATANWSRMPGERRPLVVALGASPMTDTLIVETDNGDNPPLALASATAAHPVARLLFKTDAAPLALYYGNRAAHAPRYDLALVAPQILAAEKSVATLAPEERARAEGWARTALAGDRGGIVFWSVLALVVAVLLFVVAKLLPKPSAPSGE